MFDEEDKEVSMAMSAEEVSWTNSVKGAAMEDASLKQLSDYEYAQHALFTSGNIDRCLFQIEGLQQFKEEYNINDTVEEGMTLMRLFHEQQPWLLLDIGYEQGNYIVVYDYAQMVPTALRLPEDCRIFLGGLYYLYNMLTSSLWSARKGVTVVAEVQGLGWKNFSLDFMKTFFEHLLQFYPMKFYEMSWVHNSVIGNIFESLHRSIMDDRCTNIRIGIENKAYDGRLDAIFKVPTPEIAFDRLMDKCKILLTKRYQHYRLYTLPSTIPALTEEEILLREALEGHDHDGGEDSDEEASVEEAEETNVVA